MTDSVPFPTPVPTELTSDHKFISNPIVEDKLRDAIKALIQADVAVYPVDAHGLVARSTYSPWHLDGQYRPDMTHLWPGEVWMLDMDYWAKETGGRAFYYTNGLAQAIHKALDDSKITYTLGYYPNGVAWKSEYRHIKVLVDRKGVQLRYRCGYYAMPTAGITHGNPAELLKTAASSPLDLTSLGIRVHLVSIGKPASHRLKAAIYVDGRGLTFQPEHGRYDVSFMVWAGQYSKQGRELAAKSKKVSFKLSPANYHAALNGGLGLTMQETLKPGV